MANRGGLLGAALIGAGGTCNSLETLLCEPFGIPLLPLFKPDVGAFNDEAELL